MVGNVLLHGATNYGSTNYGDYLYGEIVYDFFREKKNNVVFFQPSEFFRKNLNGYYEMKDFKIRNTQLMVYIPGGYFGDNPNTSIKESIFKFFRYFYIGLKGLLLKVPMVVLAIGAGPNERLLLNWCIRKICEKAQFVTARDGVSYASLSKLSKGKGNIEEAGDLIVSVDWDERKKETMKIKQLKKRFEGKKILLVHYNHSEKALQLFANSIDSFLETHKEYQVVITSDTVLDNEYELFSQFQKMTKVPAVLFEYEDPAEMTALLSIVDMVWTCKLHAGVVASTLRKSVVVAACHYEKTRRFYDQINESDRCVDLNNITDIDFFKIADQYADLGIDIDESVKKRAEITWCKLEACCERMLL